MGFDAPWHWIVLAIIVIALFGYKRMPDAARSLGRSLRIFKTEIKGMTDDDKKRDEAKATAELPAAHVVAVAAPDAVADATPVATAVVQPSTTVATNATVPTSNGAHASDSV